VVAATPARPSHGILESSLSLSLPHPALFHQR
jgi:hypothetical protein